MDKTLRELERQLASSPHDKKLRQQWIRHKIRIGDTVDSQTFYKIRRDKKFLSKNSQQFTTQGSRFKTEGEAIKALNSYQSMLNRWPSNSTVAKRARDAKKKTELVAYEYHLIETEARQIDCQEEVRKQELAAIQAKKRALEKKEKELLKKLGQ